MKVKQAIEFLICYVCGHDFIVSPEHVQHPECRRCHQPYRETLRDKRNHNSKSIELPNQAPQPKPRETVSAKK